MIFSMKVEVWAFSWYTSKKGVHNNQESICVQPIFCVSAYKWDQAEETPWSTKPFIMLLKKIDTNILPFFVQFTLIFICSFFSLIKFIISVAA